MRNLTVKLTAQVISDVDGITTVAILLGNRLIQIVSGNKETLINNLKSRMNNPPTIGGATK